MISRSYTMLIETEDWVKLSEAATISGIQQSVAYRTAHRLGITTKVFGHYIIRKADVPKIAENKLEPGWKFKADPMFAVECSHSGVDAALKARGLKRRPPSPPATAVKRRGRPRKNPLPAEPTT
jgi:hypothetical protein